VWWQGLLAVLEHKQAQDSRAGQGVKGDLAHPSGAAQSNTALDHAERPGAQRLRALCTKKAAKTLKTGLAFAGRLVIFSGSRPGKPADAILVKLRYGNSKRSSPWHGD